MKIIHFTLALLASLLFFACNNDDDNSKCKETETAYIFEVDAPETAKVNETVQLKAKITLVSSCGSFKQFVTSGDGKELTISAEAIYDTCSTCLYYMPSPIEDYSFTPTTTGEYILRFRSGQDEYLKIYILVEE